MWNLRTQSAAGSHDSKTGFCRERSLSAAAIVLSHQNFGMQFKFKIYLWTGKLMEVSFVEVVHSIRAWKDY